MATRSYRAEIETQIPLLRQSARALLGSGMDDLADDLVHDALSHALKTERTWLGEPVALRLFARLVVANRARLRMEQTERRTGYPAQSAPVAVQRPGGPARSNVQDAPGLPANGPLASLPIEEREALVIVVLGQLDYAVAAQALGISSATLVTRLTQARERLGHSLWRNPRVVASVGPAARNSMRSASHLRLVKS